VPAGADGERRVLWVLGLTGGFMIAEVAGGLLSGSLALIADAAHMLTDSASLLLAWAAFRLARRPATGRHTYGWRRFEVLAAYTNGIALVALVGWIAVEAVSRLLAPQPVLSGPMLVVAVLGLLVNIAGFLILNGGAKENLNLQGALLHVAGDLLGSVAAIAAALAIRFTGWTPIDPILSVLVALLILRGAVAITKEAAHILLEAAPPDLDAPGMTTVLKAVPEVLDVHHLHTWCLTPDRKLATLHAVVSDCADGDRTLDAITGTLRERFGIDHATVQLERGPCPDRHREGED
jgi:cobalt-zinc-cadmium efflux system protein